MLSVSVAILDPNEKMFLAFIKSLFIFAPDMRQLIITNNGDTIPQCLSNISKDYQHVSVDIINPGKNVGFGKAHNMALKMAREPYFAVINDDVEFFENFSTPMIKVLSDEKIGQVGMRSDTCNAINMNGFGYRDDTLKEPEYIEGSCFMLRTALAREYGLFDNIYEFAYLEDDDLSLRLRRAGFRLASLDLLWRHHRAKTSSRVNIDIQGYEVSNRQKFLSRWGAYLTRRRFGKLIVIKRSASIGDVFLITPIITTLKDRNKDCVIILQTHYPQAIAANPEIDGIAPLNIPIPCNEFYDLDYSYEKDFSTHIISSYADIIGVKPKMYRGRFYVTKEDTDYVRSIIPKHLYPFVIFDISDTWDAKQWDRNRFTKLYKLVRGQGFNVISTGIAKRPEQLPRFDFSLINSLTVLQAGVLLSEASAYVGHEGPLLHIAQSINLPCIGLYGITRPEYVSDITDKNLRTVISPVACTGCRHIKSAGTTVICQRQYTCMDRITTEMVFDAFSDLKPEKRKCQSLDT